MSLCTYGGTIGKTYESTREPGVVEIRVEGGAQNGVAGHYVRLRRFGVITWERWRARSVSADELFERVVERHYNGEDIGGL